MELKTLNSYATELDEYREKLITEYRVGFEGKLAQKFEVYSAEFRKLCAGSSSACMQMKDLEKMMDDIRLEIENADI